MSPQQKKAVGDFFDRWWPRLRDVGCSVFGAWLLVVQQARPNPSELFVTIGAMLLVVPAASLAQRWLRDKLED
jgi:hypothetical protein